MHTIHDAILLVKVIKEDLPDSLLHMFDYSNILDQLVDLSERYNVQVEELADEFYHACVKTALAEKLVKLGYEYEDALFVAELDLSVISCNMFHKTVQ